MTAGIIYHGIVSHISHPSPPAARRPDPTPQRSPCDFSILRRLNALSSAQTHFHPSNLTPWRLVDYQHDNLFVLDDD